MTFRDSVENAIYYYRIDGTSTELIYKYDVKGNRSWLPSIEQGKAFHNDKAGIPKIVFSVGETGNTIYDKVNMYN